MASGTLGAEETRERHRWSENSKVYTRKFHKKGNRNTANNNNQNSSNGNNGGSSASLLNNSSVAPQNNQTNQCSGGNTATAHKDERGDALILPSTTTNYTNGKEINNGLQLSSQTGGARTADSSPQQQQRQPPSPSPQRQNLVSPDVTSNDKQGARTADSSPQQQQRQPPSPQRQSLVSSETNNDNEINNGPQLSSHTGGVRTTDSSPPQQQQQPPSPQPQILVSSRAHSDDSLNLHQHEVVVPNGHDEGRGNGVARPVVTRVDNRVNINLVAARSSKQEVKELKRKLADELDQVRSLVKQLEAKEVQLSMVANAGLIAGTLCDTDGVGGGSARGGYGHTKFSANAGTGKGGAVRMNSEVGSVGFTDSRPFRQLTVSVADNNHRALGEIVEKEKRTPKANQFYRNSDFLLGKEKFPPAESNKKQKSGGGKKNGGGEMDLGFGMDKQVFKSCSNLLQRLMKHKHGWVFNIPVDVKGLGLLDYYDIIKHPMDLGTVKNRLDKNWYKSPREFAEDVRLTFSNAMTYNPKGQDVHVMAEQLSNIFEDKWVDIEAEYSRKIRYEMVRDIGIPTPTSRKPPVSSNFRTPVPVVPRLSQPPAIQEVRSLERPGPLALPVESSPRPVYNVPVGRAPALKKPKAKDPNKRDMTFEEKQKLSTHLQSLPTEKLDNIVQIIKKRSSALCQHDEEIEVDIDRVDAETLWELDRFVSNYKKSLSKNKRKAELALQRAESGQVVQETVPSPPKGQAPKETAAEERNDANSSPVQGEKHAEEASGSSSSSSSSSDSGSSSSDSDSDSSSGYGSDAGQ